MSKQSFIPLIILLGFFVLIVWLITRQMNTRSYFNPDGSYVGPGTANNSAPEEEYEPLPVPDDILDLVEEEEWYDNRPFIGGRWNPANWHYGDPDDDYIGGDWNPANWF